MLAKVSPFWITWLRGEPPDVADERPPPVVVVLPVGLSGTLPVPEPEELPSSSRRMEALSPGGIVGLWPPRVDRPGRALGWPAAGVTLCTGPGLLALRSFSQSSGEPPLAAPAAGVGLPVVAPRPAVPEVAVPPSGSKMSPPFLGESPGATPLASAVWG